MVSLRADEILHGNIRLRISARFRVLGRRGFVLFIQNGILDCDWLTKTAFIHKKKREL